MARRKVYTYRAVSSNGAGSYGGDQRTVAAAKARAEAQAAAWPEHGPFEVERVEHLPGGGRRYWMRQRSRWVLWNPHADADVRQPDWRWPA